MHLREPPPRLILCAPYEPPARDLALRRHDDQAPITAQETERRHRRVRCRHRIAASHGRRLRVGIERDMQHASFYRADVKILERSVQSQGRDGSRRLWKFCDDRLVIRGVLPRYSHQGQPAFLRENGQQASMVAESVRHGPDRAYCQRSGRPARIIGRFCRSPEVENSVVVPIFSNSTSPSAVPTA